MNKIRTLFLYAVSITLACYVVIEAGSELITQLTLYINGFSSSEKHRLADDLGFGLLLMIGLIPEMVIGSIGGYLVASKINKHYFASYANSRKGDG